MRPLIESMSGTRGVIGENLSPEIALKMAMAFGNFVGSGKTVILGMDTRTSGAMLANAVISGLMSVGVHTIIVGVVPTPTVQQMILHHQAQGGIVITASHNPIIWNGIKLMNESGSFFSEEEFARYRQIYLSNQYQLADWQNLGHVNADEVAIKRHIAKILEKLDVSSIKKAKLKVLIDPNNGTGCLANPLLFNELGVEFEMLNSAPNGIFAHDPEPLQKNLTGIIDKMKKGGFDIGFVQDADADRLVILDETGHFIGEDYSLAFCIDYILSQEKAQNKDVVVNLSTSSVIEWVAKKHQAKVTYTKIGEPFVTAKLKEIKAVVGGEGNGGVIYPKIGWGRDSLVGIVIALKHLAERKMKVSEIVATYPKFVMLREKIEMHDRQAIQDFLAKVQSKFPAAQINTLDGVKLNLGEEWVHARPSNTEPIVRVFIEATTMSRAKELFSGLNL